MDHPLQHIDHIMWDMEMPTSLVTVVGMMIFKEKVSKKEIERVVGNRLLQFEKFRQKIIMKKSDPIWHDDDDFDNKCITFGNCFQTRKLAVEARDKIKELLNK